jgi:hypothetical protein
MTTPTSIPSTPSEASLSAAVSRIFTEARAAAEANGVRLLHVPSLPTAEPDPVGVSRALEDPSKVLTVAEFQVDDPSTW